MPYLVDVQLDKEGGHALPILAVVLADAVHCLRHKLQHQVEEDLVLLCGGVKAVLELHHIAVVHHLHDLQLSVLEALVLQHLLDCHLQCHGHSYQHHTHQGACLDGHALSDLQLLVLEALVLQHHVLATCSATGDLSTPRTLCQELCIDVHEIGSACS